ncbi:hypothetical protein NMG60_11034665 [Bertholletia excelsa]
MMEKKEEEQRLNEEYTQDGTVDLKGKPVLRSKTGRWRACSFIVGYEVCERLAYYGIATNLVIYLTDTLHEGTVKSSNNVTNWIGTVWILPLLGAYIADAHLGRYRTFMIASAIYLLGMCLLTLAVSVPSLRPPSCPGIKDRDCDKKASAFQLGFFYAALYTIAVGTGGTKPNISTMGADQFDENEPKERTQKLSFFNWWMFSIFFGTLFSNTILVYVQDKVGWTIGYALPTGMLAVSIIVFVIGTPYYRHKTPAGSPLVRMGNVLVAAVSKWRAVPPGDPKELYELSLEEYASNGKLRIDHTSSLRFLDKAAVKSGDINSPWKLCPVTQVEETKQMMKMIPILFATFIPSTMVAQTHTLFVKQGTTLDRRMGPHFEIPPACLNAFVTISMLLTIPIYDCLLVPALRRRTGNPRGISLLQRLSIGLVLHIVIMLVSFLVERRRLSVARAHGITEKHQIVPLSIFILLPQFALVGVADGFVEVAKLEFFYDQAPEGMKSLGTAYFTTSLGVGYFLSSFILSTIAHVTKSGGHRGWILDNLNLSHLDYYYAFFVVLTFFNFLGFLVVANNFVYNANADEENGRELQEAVENSQNYPNS